MQTMSADYKKGWNDANLLSITYIDLMITALRKAHARILELRASSITDDAIDDLQIETLKEIKKIIQKSKAPEFLR